MAGESSGRKRVVSVRSVNAGSATWFAFQPALYELRPRKDGVEVYRLVRNVGGTRSSKPAAERVGRVVAQEMGCPFRSGVRQHSLGTATEQELEEIRLRQAPRGLMAEIAARRAG